VLVHDGEHEPERVVLDSGRGTGEGMHLRAMRRRIAGSGLKRF